MFKSSVCVAALAAVVAPAFAAEWMSDFEAAKAKAAQEDKAILVDFTGSDWCGYCIQLRKEVLDTPEFETYAAGKFVLMEVDMPHKKKLAPEVAKQNDILCNQYGVTSFPTLLVLSAEGRVLGGMAGFRNVFEDVTDALDQALVTQELLKKAESATGDGKALALLAAYESVPEDVREHTKLLHEVVAADVNNVTGIQDKVKDDLEIKELDDQLRACNRDTAKMKALLEQALETVRPNNKELIRKELESVTLSLEMEEVEAVLVDKGYAAALEMVDAKIPGAEGERKMMLLASKLEYQTLMAETEEDLEKARATAKEMCALMPEEMQEDFDLYIHEMFADPQELLQRVKEIRKTQEPATGE